MTTKVYPEVVGGVFVCPNCGAYEWNVRADGNIQCTDSACKSVYNIIYLTFERKA